MSMKPGLNIRQDRWAAASQANICINISATLGYIEVLRFDAKKGQFITMASQDFMFDPATRDLLEDVTKLKQTIKGLYIQHKIPLGMPTNLVVPSFFTRQFKVPESISREEVQTVLMAEAERFYVFKKIDPEIAFIPLQPDEMLYTAYPKQVVEQLKGVFRELHIPLDIIDCSYTAALRGLIGMGIVGEEVDTQVKWGMVMLSDYNVFMAVLEGGNIEKTMEVPLSMQSSDLSSLLGEVSHDFQQFYGFEVLNRMIVINNATKLMSKDMMESLGFKGQLDVYEQNDMTLSSRGVIQEAPFPCTLEAVGGAMAYMIPMIPVLDLSQQGGKKHSKMFYYRLQELLSYTLIVLGLGLLALQYAAGWTIDRSLQVATQQSTQLQTQISASHSILSSLPEIKRKLFIKAVRDHNVTLHNQMLSIFVTLPPDAWLDNIALTTPADFKSTVTQLSGGALSSDPLNTYLSELNKIMGQPPLVPNVVPQQKGSQRYFQFSISNSGPAATGSGI